jgi:hypothetical protein
MRRIPIWRDPPLSLSSILAWVRRNLVSLSLLFLAVAAVLPIVFHSSAPAQVNPADITFADNSRKKLILLQVSPFSFMCKIAQF